MDKVCSKCKCIAALGNYAPGLCDHCAPKTKAQRQEIKAEAARIRNASIAYFGGPNRNY